MHIINVATLEFWLMYKTSSPELLLVRVVPPMVSTNWNLRLSLDQDCYGQNAICVTQPPKSKRWKDECKNMHSDDKKYWTWQYTQQLMLESKIKNDWYHDADRVCSWEFKLFIKI